jgi:hypothetical protein
LKYIKDVGLLLLPKRLLPVESASLSICQLAYYCPWSLLVCPYVNWPIQSASFRVNGYVFTLQDGRCALVAKVTLLHLISLAKCRFFVEM